MTSVLRFGTGSGVGTGPRVVCHYRPGHMVGLGEFWDRYRRLVRRSAVGSVLEVGAHDLTDPAHCRNVRSPDGPGPAEGSAGASPDQLPCPRAAFDVVVCTFSWCTTADPAALLRELGRVLRPHGHILFLEHVRAPGILGEAQDEVASMLSRNRCCPNVEMSPTVRQAGLVVRHADWFWPSTLVYGPVVQGVVTHPDRQYERELGWLRGT